MSFDIILFKHVCIHAFFTSYLHFSKFSTLSEIVNFWYLCSIQFYILCLLYYISFCMKICIHFKINVHTGNWISCVKSLYSFFIIRWYYKIFDTIPFRVTHEDQNWKYDNFFSDWLSPDAPISYLVKTSMVDSYELK